VVDHVVCDTHTNPNESMANSNNMDDMNNNVVVAVFVDGANQIVKMTLI
jgi:hypothetical protein